MSIHLLMSDAGEYEAGATENSEVVESSKKAAEKAFHRMIDECETFIEGQVEIINSSAAMREHAELSYGASGGGYFYHVLWLVFPEPEDTKKTPDGLIMDYLCDENLSNAQLSKYVHRQVGYDDDDQALDQLRERYCG